VNRLKYLTILVILIPGILRCLPDEQYQREGERILRSELCYHKTKQPDLQPGPPGIEPGPLGPQVLSSHHLPLCWEDRYTEYKFKKECIVATEGYFLLRSFINLFRILCPANEFVITFAQWRWTLCARPRLVPRTYFVVWTYVNSLATAPPFIYASPQSSFAPLLAKPHLCLVTPLH
jgi:hypothetical protein